MKGSHNKKKVMCENREKKPKNLINLKTKKTNKKLETWEHKSISRDVWYKRKVHKIKESYVWELKEKTQKNDKLKNKRN
jgi:hypothetical protein